ncbi:MAG: cellulase family glycosylhydrolase [Bacillota bacterium]|nr:cellulase family glycosylhydrolase [Bacillota bacterium]
MKKFTGFERGMGIGGWLTNYKRFNVLPENRRLVLTIGDFEHFESFITEEDVAYIASLGMDHIRLGFDQIVVEEKPYEYRENILCLLENFVNWCRKYNLNVVLNLHKAIGNYCDIKQDVELLDDETLQKRFISMWIKFEERFSAYPEVAFEILNEVRNVDPDKWNDLAEDTLRAIRKTNKTRKIIIGSTCGNSARTLGSLRVYDDENVIYTFHMYEPYSFTHQQGVLQQAQLFYNRKMPYPGDIEIYRDYERVVYNDKNPFPKYNIMDKNFIHDALSSVLLFIKENPDKILWCGEFGTIRHAKIQWREDYMRDIIEFCLENEIPYCVWNYLSTPNDGNRFSLVDDDTRKILSERMAKIIRGVIND